MTGLATGVTSAGPVAYGHLMPNLTQVQTRTVLPDGREIIVNAPTPRRGNASDYYALKARQEELNSQLETTQERREDLAQQLNSKSGPDRAGIESRIGILDTRLAQLEGDLASVGREVAQSAPGSLAEPKPQIRYRGYNDGDMVGAGLSGAAILFALFVPFMIRNFRRRKFVPPGTTMPAIGGEKIDRMEQSIEAIAVEIERVSENQRFMTRLMTETQLAGTIAAVRGSTEAAKAAAEHQPNA